MIRIYARHLLFWLTAINNGFLLLSVCSTMVLLAMLMCAPFISDQEEAEIASVLRESAAITGLSMLSSVLLETAGCILVKEPETTQANAAEQVNCRNCKYASQNLYLPCAVNPSGYGQICKDWEPK